MLAWLLSAKEFRESNEKSFVIAINEQTFSNSSYSSKNSQNLRNSVIENVNECVLLKSYIFFQIRVVKEEISDENAKLPCVGGRVVSWVSNSILSGYKFTIYYYFYFNI